MSRTALEDSPDFATGGKLTLNNTEHRHYNHIYPDILLKEAEINSYLALNCALISGRKNISIGRKEPLQYLKERYEWTAEEIVKERTHFRVSNGGYEGLSEAEKKDKIEKYFEQFDMKRAEIVWTAVNLLIR